MALAMAALGIEPQYKVYGVGITVPAKHLEIVSHGVAERIICDDLPSVGCQAELKVGHGLLRFDGASVAPGGILV